MQLFNALDLCFSPMKLSVSVEERQLELIVCTIYLRLLVNQSLINSLRIVYFGTFS